jgi:hypothetical protein
MKLRNVRMRHKNTEPGCRGDWTWNLRALQLHLLLEEGQRRLRRRLPFDDLRQ